MATLMLSQEQVSELEVVEKTTQELLVDKIVKLSTKVEKAKSLIKEFDADKKALSSLIPEDAPTDEPFTFTTDEGSVTFSKPTSKMTVTDMKKVMEFMGEEVFLQVAKVSIEDLKSYLTKRQLDEVTEVSLSGSRSFKSAVKN